MTRALCMVAHPDDCLIFGYHYILSHRQYRWTIGYLILDDHSPRVEEMRGYWARHAIDVFSLDLPHDPPPSDLSSCLLYTSPSPRDRQKSRMPSSA